MADSADGMGDLDAPTCPNDGTVLRDIPDGLACACGYVLPYDDVERPTFDGPSIRGG